MSATHTPKIGDVYAAGDISSYFIAVHGLANTARLLGVRFGAPRKRREMRGERSVVIAEATVVEVGHPPQPLAGVSYGEDGEFFKVTP